MAMNFYVILCFVCFIFVNCRYASGACKTSNGGTGTCVPLSSCEPLMVVLRGAVSNPINTWLLRQAHCGFNGNEPKVCCPVEQKANVIDPATPASTTQAPSTTTQTPFTTTQAPFTTAQTPYFTQTPSTTTQTPSTTTQTPSTTAQTPSTTTQTPSTATQAQTSTQASSTISRAPSMTTQAALKTSTTQGKLENEARINLPSKYNYDLVILLGETCTTVYNTTGSCKELILCEPFRALINSARFNPADERILRQSHCGFIDTRPKVCCPLPGQPTTLIPPVTVLPSTDARAGRVNLTSNSRAPVPGVNSVSPNNVVIGVSAKLEDACTTVYNSTGSCKELALCEPFSALIRTARFNPAHRRTLQQSHCGFIGSKPKVCCPSSPRTTPTSPVGDYLTSLPEPPVCGVSNMSLNKVVNGVPAKLGSFPWMALLAYQDLAVASGFRWKCGGSLISIRHVLTAAHCIHNVEDDLTFVRLGELDWARDDDGATPIDVPIKQKIKHEKYSRNNPMRYDIGLLVLQRDIEFTDLIKPICLPLKYRTMNFENYNPIVAGWGNINRQYNGIVATHLQVAQVPVLEQKTCELAYKDYIYDGFYEQAFCAGYMAGKIDACSGDSGGPLMQPMPGERYSETYSYCIGVVSFGRGCAQAGSPGVYARVTHYLPWIEQKIFGKTSS